MFFQNGMLDPLLEKYGLQLSPSNPNRSTHCLVYFTVAKPGAKATDGVTAVSPEGLTAAFGRHAESLARRLRRAGVSIVVLHCSVSNECLSLTFQCGHGQALCLSLVLSVSTPLSVSLSLCGRTVLQFAG